MLTDAFVPLLTYPDQTRETSFPALIGLLEAMGTTHVSFCGVEIDVPDLADRWGAALVALPQMAAEVERRSSQSAADLLSAASSSSKRLVAEQLTIRAAFGDPGAAVSQRARHHDFTALPIRRGSVDHQAVAEDLLFGSGRPLLIMPDDREFSAPLSRVAIAWDGTPTAYRAIHNAISLIARVRDVVLLSAPQEKAIPQAITNGLVGYLVRHGSRAEPIEVTCTEDGLARDLQSAAHNSGAGILVMGGYGHSRLREFILGGVTEGVLNDPRMPILMSH
jgi:Universal stress protein UspA and related nucleotide-binding proteins